MREKVTNNLFQSIRSLLFCFLDSQFLFYSVYRHAATVATIRTGASLRIRVQ